MFRVTFRNDIVIPILVTLLILVAICCGGYLYETNPAVIANDKEDARVGAILAKKCKPVLEPDGKASANFTCEVFVFIPDTRLFSGKRKRLALLRDLLVSSGWEASASVRYLDSSILGYPAVRSIDPTSAVGPGDPAYPKLVAEYLAEFKE